MEQAFVPRVDVDSRHNEMRHSVAIGQVERAMSSFSHRVQTTLRACANAIDPALPPFGYKLLHLVERDGPVQAGVAADILFVDRSVVSRHVRLLEELGLLVLLADPTDGRARMLALTPEGAERLASINPAGRSLLFRLLEEWSDEDLESFASYLERLGEKGDEPDPRA
jgi:DNA-binding MarR family transcriptional regulator